MDHKNKLDLSRTIEAGQTLWIKIPSIGLQIPNSGGVIPLLDSKGLKVDGVSYMAKDTIREGWSVAF